VELGNLTALLQKIQPAVDEETETYDNRTSSNADFVERVASLNVKRVKRQVIERSPILAAMLDNSEIALLGGMYDVESGAVDFYDSLMIMGAQ